MVTSEPYTILPLESFNVPDFVNEKVIPMLKMMMRVRNHGAPLIVVDKIALDFGLEGGMKGWPIGWYLFFH